MLQSAATHEIAHEIPERPAQRYAHSRRILGLDGVRAFAILLVFFQHGLETDGSHPTAFLRRFAAAGILGVQIFFVLSGFLITRLLIEEKDLTGTISLRRFYIRRALRLMPVLYVFLSALLVARILGLVQVKPWEFLVGLAYTMNFLPHQSWPIGHLWSLSLEEQFYLLWPLLLATCSRRVGIRALLITIVCVPVIRAYVFYYDPQGDSLSSILAPQFGDTLAIGCLCALWLPALKQNRAFRNFISSPVIFLLPLVMLALNSLRLRPDRVPMWLALPLGQSLISVCAALIVAKVVILQSSRFTRFLSWPPIATVGVLSYSLYIWQQPFLNPYSHFWWNRWPLNVIIAACLATASYFLLEKPILRLRRRFA